VNRRADVLDAALVVAATRGVAAMSMRAVADQVGLTVMGLYRHVRDKDDLLDGLVGRTLAEIDLPADDQPWELRLRAITSQLLTLAGRYPTVMPLLLTRAYSAPDAVAVVDALHRVLGDAGVAADQIPRLERLISTFTLGYAVAAANNGFWADPTATSPPTDPVRVAGPDDAAPHDPNAATSIEAWAADFDADITDLIQLIRGVVR